jgi:hypothetical protein
LFVAHVAGGADVTLIVLGELEQASQLEAVGVDVSMTTARRNAWTGSHHEHPPRAHR